MSKALKLQTAIGPRGFTTVSSNTNLGDVKKWLVCMGVGGALARELTLSELQTAYNDTTDESLIKLRRGKRLIASPTVTPKAPVITPTVVEPAPGWVAPPVHTSKPVEPVSTSVASTAAQNGNPFDASQLAALQQLLSILIPKGGIDAEAVRAIMREELPGMIPTRVVEIHSNGTVTKLPAGLRHKQFEDLLFYVMLRENVVLVGPAGSGKTTMAEQVSEAVGLKFHTTGALDSSFLLSGHTDGAGTYHSTAFRHSFQNGGTFIGDEMDGWDSNALLWVNGATANGYATFPDSPHPIQKHPDFVFVACMNTFGNGASRQYVGRNQLDAATLDRFVFLHITYDEKLERHLANNDKWVDHVQAMRKAADELKARLVISPRASMKGARALAAGRAWHLVEDEVLWKGTEPELRRKIIEQSRKAA